MQCFTQWRPYLVRCQGLGGPRDADTDFAKNLRDSDQIGQQEAPLSQRGRAMLRVIDCVAKSLTVT